MNRIDVLIAVDVVGAIAAGSLQGYVYLVDTNKYLGSWQEGQSTLNTVCQDGQALTWSIASIDPGNEVNIAGFGGQMVTGKTCVPAQDPFAGNTVWHGQVETQGAFASYAYTVTVTMNGRQMTFSAVLKVV